MAKSAMKVEEIGTFRSYEGTGPVVAFTNIVLNGLVIRGIKVMSKRNKELRIGFPSEKGKDGKYRDTVFTRTKEDRASVTSQVLAAAEKAGIKATA